MAQSPYREHILDHFQNPRHRGQLSKPDRIGEADNSICGDQVRIELRLNGAGRVAEAAFSGDGCVIALASASMLTEYVPGQEVEELHHLSEQDIVDLLGVDLGPARSQCAWVALRALQAALS
jgi:nitrogen fixation NifU-like protein